MAAVDATLPGGVTDNQSFCYDEQVRLTWASSSSGTGPCGIVNNGGSLTAGNAKYTASCAYDNLDRLTSCPANGGSTYTYGDSAHLHAATSTSGGYSATYDAAGDMTCRAPTSSTTCTGSSLTGAGLTYDNEGQLTHWTSALTGQPTSATDTFAYDGEGSRVAQRTNSGGSGITTTTDYLLGGLEEQQTVGGSVRPSTTLTEYYPLPGIGTAVRVSSSSGGGTHSYLAGDQLGSVTVVLSTSGTVTAQALYSPYGTVRYSSGTMPTAHGYTGQLADAATGLDYYGARYYDPSLGEFTSADTEIEGGLDRYAYVGDSPCTYNDPSGHCKMPKRASVDAYIAALGLIIQFAKYLIPGLGGIPAPPGGGAMTPPTAVVALAPPNTTTNTPIAPGDDPTAIDYGNGNYGGENDNNPTADVLQDIANNSNSRPCGSPAPKQKPSRWYYVRRWVRAPNGRPLGRYQPVGEPLPVSYPLPVPAPLPVPVPVPAPPGIAPAPETTPGFRAQRWYLWETQQEWQDQLALAQDARMAHLETVNSVGETYLPDLSGAFGSTSCYTDGTCFWDSAGHKGSIR